MRLGGCILLELCLASTFIVGAGFAAQRVGSAVTRELARHDGPPADLSAANLVARRDLSVLPEVDIAREPAGSFLGMSDEILLDRVRSQPIVRFKVKGGGSSLSFRIDFADGSRAAWKPAQTNLQTIPRKEVAAYRLNRLLGLNAVPPAAPRAVTRDELFAHLHPESAAHVPRIRAETIFDPSGKSLGAASYWIPEIRDSGLDSPEGMLLWANWLAQGQPIPPDKRQIAAQMADLVVFDFLTANPDRYSGANIKMSADATRLFFMDNTMSFFVQPEGNDKTRWALMRTQRFSKRLYDALDRLDPGSVQRAIAEEPSAAAHEILTPGEIRAVVARRDVVKRHIDHLAMQFGAKNVLAFP